ncbi:MAG: cell division protein FtsZ [Synergistaceae bacterium]|nr:cell division protein FtsZ [Synergistaceae bacterium]MDD2350210.1 cell division protein FtsZ [Synergistaceae bacterium]MDD4704566.1 cell division protein FtsZ [Synergistaceae bacterium]
MSIPATELCYPYPEESEGTSKAKTPSAQNRSEPARRESIKVIAVGGGGGNALNHIITKGIEGVDILAVNTDIRSLDMSLSHNKIVLGEKVTKGLGAGALPHIGEQAAKESLSEIREYLRGSDMVYLTAGMGGGTGTGALPIIAQTAKEMGILTVAVVTKPFMFEGARRMRYAEEGIAKLRQCVDALIIVPNDRLLEICRKETPLSESFSMVDEVLRQAVQGVTDLVMRPGMVNVDFADLKAVMKHAGIAVMGVGCAKGENRIDNALREALESPLMECSMHGAKGVLMNITCGEGLGIFEVQQAAAYIEEIISDDATFVWGCAEDSDMEENVEIVIVATGFEDGSPEGNRSLQEPPVSAHRPIFKQEIQRPVWHEPISVAAGEKTEKDAPPVPEVRRGPSWLEEKVEMPPEEATPKELSEELDEPTFLRKNKTSGKPQTD